MSKAVPPRDQRLIRSNSLKSEELVPAEVDREGSRSLEASIDLKTRGRVSANRVLTSKWNLKNPPERRKDGIAASNRFGCSRTIAFSAFAGLV